MRNGLIQASYVIAALLFIFGLRRMSSPRTARGGIWWAGGGMVLATVATFFWPGLTNYVLMAVAIVVGGGVSVFLGGRVKMTAMPQMIALFNGMGGGAAACISAIELLRGGAGHDVVVLAVLGGIIGTVSFSGSIIAFAKLQGWLDRSILLPFRNVINMAALALALVAAGFVIAGFGGVWIALLFVFSFVFGVLMTLPIGGADMPVVISLYNALTGLAVGFEGYVLGNAALMVAGVVVGAAGTLLTQLMARAMNRSLANVLFSGFGAEGGAAAAMLAGGGEMKPIDFEDAAIMLAYANRVIIVPGYGMAVAQAQHTVWTLAELLQQRGVEVKFAIHPVAGRMPGHMNVLLAEAGVPYDLIHDMEDINQEFPTTDVSVVIGANDVVNPAARTDTGSPIYGMPILDVDKSKNVLVIKRGKGTGFAGVENSLFTGDNTRMLFGDAQAVANELVAEVKKL